MGNPKRGQDVQIRVLKDGALVGLWNAQSATFNMDDTKERENRLGTARKPNRQRIHGHSGTITFESERPDLEDLVDELIAASVATDHENFKVEIIRRDYFPGTKETRAWRYPGTIFSVDQNAGGQDDPVEDTLNWQSEPRKKL